MKQVDKIALREWEKLKADIARDTPADPNMTHAQRLAHRTRLEANPVEWIKFFCAPYCTSEFADFQKKAIRRIVARDEWFEVLSWSRELAKSTITMCVVLYLALTGRKRNIILTSNSKDNAVRLLAPYRAMLESNGRIEAYYGTQPTPGSWTEDEFITRAGVAFRALGAGQSPRGSRNEAIRPDTFLVDDFDTDEDCRNPDTINKRWEWWEKALYPARSVSKPTLVVFCGNIIARDCCVTRAGEIADHWDIVNIRDRQGHSTWPQKNTEAHIDRVLSKISSKAAQGEYFNNPVSEGEVFKNITFGKVPPLSRFKHLVIYGDPSPESRAQKKASHSRRSRSSASSTAGCTSSAHALTKLSTPSLSTGMCSSSKAPPAKPTCIATWKTTNSRTPSFSRCSAHLSPKCAKSAASRCTYSRTSDAKPTRQPASRQTLNP